MESSMDLRLKYWENNRLKCVHHSSSLSIAERAVAIFEFFFTTSDSFLLLLHTALFPFRAGCCKTNRMAHSNDKIINKRLWNSLRMLTMTTTLIIITRSQSGEIETKKGFGKNKQMFKNGNKMKIDRKINNTTMTTNHVRRLSHTFFLVEDEEKSVCFIQSKQFVRYSLCVFFLFSFH